MEYNIRVRKVFFTILLFLLFMFFGTTRTVYAVSCCPDTGPTTQFKYNYDPATKKCVLSGPQGSVVANSNCTQDQFCNSSKQCENYQQPTTPGCNTNPTTGNPCITPANTTVYCSSDAECEKAKKALQSGASQSGDKVQTGPSILDCGGGKQGLNTAVGCIPFGDNTTSTDLIGFILRWAIGVGGGIAFLLILYAGFQIMTSSGDPNKLKAGQELLTAAISGLIMLIFSVFILRVIGVDILKIF